MTVDDLAPRVAVNPYTSCWEWQGCVQGNGYGRVRANGRTRYAHRVAYEAANGVIPEGMSVLHGCDNRRCCNPAHLFLGDHQANATDAKKKGRLSRGRRHSRLISGERAGSAKLTWEQVHEIRRMPRDRTTARRFAAEMGVSKDNIRRILNYDTWRFAK